MLTAPVAPGPAPSDAPGVSCPVLPASVPDGGAGLSIGLLAHVGMQNLGDEIMFASALAYYRARLPRARFVAFTMGPADTKRRYGLDEAHPIRPETPADDRAAAKGRAAAWFRTVRSAWSALWREARFARLSAARLRGLDIVIVPGSSQFIDAYGGPLGFPLALFRWTAHARLARVPICYLSMGAEELGHPLSRWLVRCTVRLAHFISLRDRVSRDRLEAQGVRRAIPLAPDLSLAHAWDAPIRRVAGTIGVVGINPIPYFHRVFWRRVDDARYRRYVDQMVELTVRLVERGRAVVLYGTTHWADRVPMQDIHAAARARLGPATGGRVTMAEVHTLDDLHGVLARVDLVVASRYHGVATALLMHHPVIGIAYERKTADLMAQFGLAAFAVDIDHIDGAALADMSWRLEHEHHDIRASLEARVRSGRRAVHAQFDEVLRMYGVRRRPA